MVTGTRRYLPVPTSVRRNSRSRRHNGCGPVGGSRDRIDHRQQLDVVVEDEETASVAEEIIKEAERNGLTGTPQMPVLSSSASGEDELGEGAGDERRSVSPSSARVHGYGAVVASEPAAAGSTGSPEQVSISTRSVPAVTGTLEPESSSLRRGGFQSGLSGCSRRFLPSWLAPESRAADTSIPHIRLRSSLGGGGYDR